MLRIAAIGMRGRYQVVIHDEAADHGLGVQVDDRKEKKGGEEAHVDGGGRSGSGVMIVTGGERILPKVRAAGFMLLPVVLGVPHRRPSYLSRHSVR